VYFTECLVVTGGILTRRPKKSLRYLLAKARETLTNKEQVPSITLLKNYSN